MTGYTSIPLPPVRPAIAVYPEYVRSEETVLDIVQQPMSLSGSDFIIKDNTGEIFKCTGAALLSGDPKVITDTSGRELYRIQNKTTLLSKEFSAENAAGETVLTSVRANFHATLTNTITGKEAVIRLKGNIWASQAEATLDPATESETESEATVGSGKDPIARIRRHIWSKEDIFLNRRRHTLTIAPGVDISLLAAICMCFDECKNEPRPHSLGL